MEEIFPYAQAGLVQTVGKNGQLLSEEYREDGVYVKAYLPKEEYLRLMGKLGWTHH